MRGHPDSPTATLAQALMQTRQPNAIAALTALQALRQRIGDRDAMPAEIASALAGREGAAEAAQAIAAIDLNHPDIPLLLQCHREQAPPSAPPPTRPRTCSIAPDELPVDLARQLHSLRTARPGRYFKKTGTASIGQMEAYLCLLCFSARAAGLEPRFSPETVHAFLHDMVERGNKAATIHTRLNTLGQFARCFDLPFPFASEIAFWWAMRKTETKRAQETIERKGLSSEDYLAEARRVLAQTHAACDICQRIKSYNKAGAFGLASECPLRRGDMAALVMGDNAWRDDRQWQFRVVQIKTGVEQTIRLAEHVTPLLDGVILRGAAPDQLQRLCQQRKGKPLFISADGSATTPNAISRWFRAHFGTGPHITRNLIYLARAGDPGGLEDAAARCGHISPDTAAVYMPASGWRERSQAAHARRQKHVTRLLGRNRAKKQG